MINIVVPMAGAGSRFAQEGYEKPKPFIDVKGKPMIVRVLENLKCKNAKYFLVAREEHMAQERALVKKITNECNVVFIPVTKLTEGIACTVLYAREYINNKNPLLIANSDQVVDGGVAGFVGDCLGRKLDGSILTFIDKFRDPKWSFVKVKKDGTVSKVKEKEAISKYATVGIYFYAKGQDYVNAAIDMIIENDRVNGEFYTCPTYNYAVKQGKKIGIYNIRFEQMHGLGTPKDLNIYLGTIK